MIVPSSIHDMSIISVRYKCLIKKLNLINQFNQNYGTFQLIISFYLFETFENYSLR